MQFVRVFYFHSEAALAANAFVYGPTWLSTVEMEVLLEVPHYGQVAK